MTLIFVYSRICYNSDDIFHEVFSEQRNSITQNSCLLEIIIFVV